VDPNDLAAQTANQAHRENLAKFANHADYLVLPGLLANRKARTVRLWGRSTSVTHTDPIEFFVLPPDSGKDYEALTVGFAKPSDVHKALAFIGMPAGRPVNFSQNQFWPKGERVIMTFEWDQPPAEGQKDKKPTSQRVRAEELIVDTRTGKPLGSEGLVFVGSYMIEAEDGGAARYAADVVDPRSIASNFNCGATVLDVPRQAVQGDVYGLQKLNPAYRFTAGQALQIVLEPQSRDGATRVRDLVLKVTVPPNQPDATIQTCQFDLKDAQGKPATDGRSFIHLLAGFGEITEARQDPFVTIEPDERMTIRRVRDLYTVLMSLESEQGIRLEAPPAGHLYGRAFFPREEWRDRTKRLGRPWELHLTKKEQALTGLLILPADDIDNNNGMGDLSFPVTTAEQTARTLAEKSDRWSRMVYIFAPPELPYGELMAFIRPSMRTHQTIYVFPAKAE
jgi:hypothetical protein